MQVMGDDGVRWRQLTDRLWVGLIPEGVIGCIEVGRRCLVTDGEGHEFGRYRRLEDAKAMLAFLHREGAVGPTARRRVRAGATS